MSLFKRISNTLRGVLGFSTSQSREVQRAGERRQAAALAEQGRQLARFSATAPVQLRDVLAASGLSSSSIARTRGSDLAAAISAAKLGHVLDLRQFAANQRLMQLQSRIQPVQQVAALGFGALGLAGALSPLLAGGLASTVRGGAGGIGGGLAGALAGGLGFGGGPSLTPFGIARGARTTGVGLGTFGG